MLQITYKPSTSGESQSFLNDLCSVLNPLDVIRKNEIKEVGKEDLPAMGGAIEDFVTNPVTWQISETIIKDILIPTLVALFIRQLDNKATKRLKIGIDNSIKIILNLNNYNNPVEFEEDLKKKFLKGD